MPEKDVKKVVLVILDGWGVAKPNKTNAISLAKTPTLDRLKKEALYTQLYASQKYVGLPKGFMGNSEVGHIHIGAGRLIPQDMIRIDEEIKKGRFYKNKVLLKTVQNVKKKKGVLHLMGLLSDGGVHSHINHLFALLDFAKKNGIKEVYIHTFLDGRDVPPKSAAKYLKQADDYTKKIGIGKIETIMGRFYAMDRDNRWNREHMAYSALAECQGLKYATWK